VLCDPNVYWFEAGVLDSEDDGTVYRDVQRQFHGDRRFVCLRSNSRLSDGYRNNHYAGHGPGSNCSGTRLAVSGEPEGRTGLGEILPSAAYMARLAVAAA
jgi:hypothetical protein